MRCQASSPHLAPGPRHNMEILKNVYKPKNKTTPHGDLEKRSEVKKQKPHR